MKCPGLCCSLFLLSLLCIPTTRAYAPFQRRPFVQRSHHHSASERTRWSSSSFLVHPRGRLGNGRPCRPAVAASRATSTHSSEDQPVETGDSQKRTTELSDERKAALFQFLLRDLQVEGVPLLSIDVVQEASTSGANDDPRLSYSILQAAVWTTLAELVDQQQQLVEEQQVDEKDSPPSAALNKACLVFEHVTVPELQRLVDHYENTLKKDDRIASTFPEISNVRLSLVGKGIGPALLLEVVEITNDTAAADESPATDDPVTSRSQEKDHRALAAMKMFVDRAGLLCDDSRAVNDDSAATQEVSANYRICNFCDAFHIHGSFWNCMCEVLQQSSSSAPSSSPHQPPRQSSPPTFLLLPEMDDDTRTIERQQQRFNVLTWMLTQSLELFNNDWTNDNQVEVQYYSPTYDRSKISPAHDEVRGHLPPLSRLGGDDDDLEDDGSLLNHLRRSPVTSCRIRYRAAPAAMASDDDANSARRVVRQNRRELDRLVHRTLEQAFQAERDVATGTMRSFHE